MNTKKKLWHYRGEYYHNGIKQIGEVDLYTAASSFREARRNTIWKIKKGLRYSRFADIDIADGLLHCEETVVFKTKKVAKAFAGEQLSIFPKTREE